jgi:hypothetical protein
MAASGGMWAKTTVAGGAVARLFVPQARVGAALAKSRPNAKKTLSAYSTADLLASNAVRYGDASVEDKGLLAIAEARGYTAPPQVVSREEMNALVEAGAQELWRGFKGRADLGKSAADFAEEMRSGPYWAGRGIAGSGTYAAIDWDYAADYAAWEEDAMLRMALAKGAKVTTGQELATQMAHARGMFDRRTAALQTRWQAEGADNLTERLERRQVERDAFYGDVGRYAALRGYDAIYQIGTDGVTPIAAVILNRKKLLVQDTGYNGAGFFGQAPDAPTTRQYVQTGVKFWEG